MADDLCRRGRPVLRRPARPARRPSARPDLVPAAPAAHAGHADRGGERRRPDRSRRGRGIANLLGGAAVAGPQSDAGPVHRGVLGGGAGVGHAPRRPSGRSRPAGDGRQPFPCQPQQRTLGRPRPDVAGPGAGPAQGPVPGVHEHQRPDPPFGRAAGQPGRDHARRLSADHRRGSGGADLGRRERGRRRRVGRERADRADAPPTTSRPSR